MQGPKLQLSGFGPLDKEALDKEEKAALSKDEIPSLYPPFPQGTKVGTQDLPDAAAMELIEKAKFFQDFFRYSGYYQPAKRNDAVLHVERYSDRFRRVEGQRGLFEEIVEPSPMIFPEELFSGLTQTRTRQSRKGHQGFKSSKALAKSREILATTVDERTATLLITQPQGPEPEVEEEDEEEESPAEEEEAADEEMSEADDYTELYGDDDEDGGDVFGADDEDVF